MNLTTTLLFSLVFGIAVAVAAYLSAPDASRSQRWFKTLTAVIFWPLYLPALLQRPVNRFSRAVENGEPIVLLGEATADDDEMVAEIHRVERELALALTSLGGWSDDVLIREEHRFEELRVAWHSQAAKVRELDRILGQLAISETATVSSPEPSERVANCQRARQANIARLHALRDCCYTDLMGMLARVRELVTMIHLAKYTGAPASRAEELLMQIATSIEGLTEVASWRDADSSTISMPSGAA